VCSPIRLTRPGATAMAVVTGTTSSKRSTESLFKDGDDDDDDEKYFPNNVLTVSSLVSIVMNPEFLLSTIENSFVVFVILGTILL
jgi:hypothetical protein